MPWRCLCVALCLTPGHCLCILWLEVKTLGSSSLVVTYSEWPWPSQCLIFFSAIKYRVCLLSHSSDLHRWNNQKCKRVVPKVAAWLWADTVLMPIRQNRPHPFRQSSACVTGWCYTKETLWKAKRCMEGYWSFWLIMLLLVTWWITDSTSLLRLFYKYSWTSLLCYVMRNSATHIWSNTCQSPPTSRRGMEWMYMYVYFPESRRHLLKFPKDR